MGPGNLLCVGVIKVRWSCWFGVARERFFEGKTEFAGIAKCLLRVAAEGRTIDGGR